MAHPATLIHKEKIKYQLKLNKSYGIENKIATHCF